MKKLVWFLGGMAAAAAGFLVWNTDRSQTLQQPAFSLENDPSEDPNRV